MAAQTSVDKPPSEEGRKRSSGMLGSSFRILKVRGISIGAHWSWLLVFGLVSYSLATDLFPSSYPGLPQGTYLAMGLAAAVIFFASIVLHELGHAFRALKEGMKIGDITLWLFGGVARFEGMFPSAGAEFRVAIAGPVVSLVLAIAFALVDWAGRSIGLPETVTGVAAYLARINGAVLLFNLVPALPLDGGRVLRSWLWQRQRSFVAATMSAAKAGKAFAYILMTIGIMGFFSNAVDGGVWMVFLGFFILQAAQSEVQYALVTKAFTPYTVRALMTVNPVVVSTEMTVAEFVDMAARIGHSTYPVTEADGRLAGLMSMRRVNQLPLEGRPTMPVREAMLPAGQVVVLRPGTPMMEALTALQEPPHRAVVLDSEQVVGFISMSDVARSLQLEQARGALAPEPEARRSGTLVWVVVALLMAMAAGTFYRPPLAVISPAPAEDITNDITIKGIDAQKPNGKFLLLAVSLSQTNALGTLWAMLDPNSDVIPVSAVVPEGISARDFDRQQTDIFKESRLLAAAAAAEAVGLDATLKGTGARVIDLVDGSPASKVLKQRDVVVAVDGKPVALATDLRDAISTRSPGTTFTLTVERGGKPTDIQISSARLQELGTPPGIGVLIETRDFDVDLPFEIEFKELNVGGPSAGLAYALAIADMLDPGDYAEGRTVAASGTITADGRVGPVGGLNQKTEAAKDAGADVLVVPQEEVSSIRRPDIKLHGVENLKDAIQVLSA